MDKQYKWFTVPQATRQSRSQFGVHPLTSSYSPPFKEGAAVLCYLQTGALFCGVLRISGR